MNNQIVALFSQIRSARRYKWFSVGIVWLLCLGGWALVSQMPDQFRSEARVRIDSATVVAPILAERRIEVDEPTRIAFVIELLLGNDSIKRMADMAVVSGKSDEADDAALESFRASVDITGGENDVYVVSAVQEDPKASLQMLNTALSALGETARAMLDNDAAGEIKVLDQKIQDLEGKLNEATQGSAAKPVSQEPQDPRYQVLKSEMDSLLKRRDEVRAVRDREVQAHPDLFRVLEQPVEPSAPFSPNRVALHGIVLLSALAVAMLMALLVNLVRPAMSSAENLHAVTGLPVLGSVQVIESPAYQRIHRFSRLAFAAALAGLGILFLALIMLESNGLNLHHLSA